MSENSAKVLPEIGTLWADRNGDSRFVGSASGVYFLKTVQSAFVSAAARSNATGQNDDAASQTSPHSQWSAEQIFGSEDGATAARSSEATAARTRYANSHNFFETPQQLPAYGIAKRLTKVYFETWHSFAPFLHGPSFLAEMEEMLAGNDSDHANDHSITCRNIIFQCVWNLALLDVPELKPVGGIYDCTPERLIPALGVVALQDSLVSIQALLSAQLLFIATMSLRSASITGGLIVRAVMKAGLHRCPFRYADIAPSDRDIRKRVFWTVYVFDRFLSQALGQPLGIQDSDVDVCPPGITDLHSPAGHPGHQPENPVEDTRMHLPTTHPNYAASLKDFRERQSTVESDCTSPVRPQSKHKTPRASTPITRRQENQSVLANSVASSRFLGRALEIFHKSIHVRAASAREVLLLKVDIETWGNDAVYTWTELKGADSQKESDSKLASLKSSLFSIISYHQLLLFMNRPSLAAKESTAEFMLALQTCLSASRSILQTLRLYLDNGGHIFWPGHLLAVWMCGLVIAFACRVNAYDVEKSIMGLSQALDMLKTLRSRWSQAIACHSVLSELLENIKNRREMEEGIHVEATAETTNQRPAKRRRVNGEDLIDGTPAYDKPPSGVQVDERIESIPRMNDRRSGSLPVGPASGVLDQSRSWSSSMYTQPPPLNQLHPGALPTTSIAPVEASNGLRGNGINLPDGNSNEFPISDFYQVQWPQGFDVGDMRGMGPDEGFDFMVWDSLQQLVTNFD